MAGDDHVESGSFGLEIKAGQIVKYVDGDPA